eukprot:g393.t1
MRRGTGSKEVLKGKTILAPIDSDGLDAVFYVFCGPGKTEMEMKDFFCRNTKITDATLPPAVAELIFNDHRVKEHGKRTLEAWLQSRKRLLKQRSRPGVLSWFGAALEQLAERKHVKVSDLHTVALLTGGPQAKLTPSKGGEPRLKGRRMRSRRVSRIQRDTKKLQPILQDKEGWRRDVDNAQLWKTFGLSTSAGRALRQIYGANVVPPPPEPPRMPSVCSLKLQKIQGALDCGTRLQPPGMSQSISLPSLRVSESPKASESLPLLSAGTRLVR